MKKSNLKLFTVFCLLFTALFLFPQKLSAEIIFKDNFNTVSGSENVNDSYDNPGRQTGTMAPILYKNVGPIATVGDGTSYPNWLNKPTGPISPNLNFNSLNNFVLEFDLIKTNASSWVSIVFGSTVQGAAGNAPNGGHGLLIHTTGAYILREGENTLIATGNLPIATNYHFAICVSTESYGGTDKPKISIFVNNVPLKVDDANNSYTRISNCAYTDNYITFYNAGAKSVALDNFSISSSETTLSTKLWLDDGDMMLDSSRNYSHKINFYTNANVTINSGAGDVTFDYSLTGQTTGVNWKLGGVSENWLFENDNTAINHIALDGKALTASHIENSNAEGNYLKLTGLNPGDFGRLKLYGVSKHELTLPNHRSNYFAISSGGQLLIDQNEFSDGTGIIAEINYKVPDNGELTIAATPVAADNKHRFKWTAFSNYQIASSFPDIPDSVSATKGSPNDKIIVTWNSANQADKYKVFRNLVDDANSAANISGELGDVALFDDTTTEYNSNYFYWVKAGNSSGWSDFSDYDIGFRTDSTGPAKPTNFSPANGATPEFPITLATLAYSDIWPFATSQWQLSSQSDFSFPKKTYNYGTVTNISPPNGNLYNGTNFWRVKFKNDKNQWSDWSDATFFIVNRNTNSPFYFYETFNNVSGNGNVNKEYDVSGRQIGTIATLDYSVLGATEVGISAAEPNKLKLTGVAACSPNNSFEDYGNFKIECEIEPSLSGTAITFGKLSQNEVPESVGGMAFVFYGDTLGTYKVYSGITLLGTFNNDEIKSPAFHFRVTVSTPDFDNSDAEIAAFINGEPIVLWQDDWEQPFQTNHYNYYYEKKSAFKDNYITLYNFGGQGIFDNLEIQMAQGNNLNVYHWANDADSRINSAYNYTYAVNLNSDEEKNINGVDFLGTGIGCPNFSALAGSNTFLGNGSPCLTSNNWEVRTADGMLEIDNDFWNMPTPDVAGNGAELLSHIAFDSHDGIQIRLKVTPGSSNVFAMHFCSWWGANFKYPVSGNDGSVPALAPIDYEAKKGSVLEYEYKAPDNGEFIFTLSSASHPIYSFSNYETATAEPEIYTLDLLDFGEVAAGQTKTFKLPIFNFGAGTVSGIVTGADSQFEFLNGSNYFAKSESPDFLNISFTPEFEEEYSNIVFLTGSGGTMQVELKGLGVPEGGIVFSILFSVFSIFIFRKRK